MSYIVQEKEKDRVDWNVNVNMSVNMSVKAHDMNIYSIQPI